MADTSQFSHSYSSYDDMEQMLSQGATCDAFRVKIYGKLHFLKRLKPQYAADIRYHEALRKEFETGYRLEHPHLVRYVFYDENGILMEYVDGETLSRHLAAHPDYFRNKKNVDKFLHQLLDVVSFLHDQQVLHLDLKPDNIMLTRIGNNVKLIDLGCSLTDTFTDTTGHTPAFAAPEQQTDGEVDVRTDIYAIGKILQQIPHSHKYNKVIARCVAEDKDERYNTIEELKTAINRRDLTIRFCSWATVVLAFAILLFSFVLARKKPSTEETLPKMHVNKLIPIKEVTTSKPDTIIVPVAPNTPNAPSAPNPSSTKPQNENVKHTQNTLKEDIQHTQNTLKEDIQKSILPKFQATMGLLPDSVKPGSQEWYLAGWALEDSLKYTLQELILRHLDIPMETIAKEFNDYLQSLIATKYNRAMGQ